MSSTPTGAFAPPRFRLLQGDGESGPPASTTAHPGVNDAEKVARLAGEIHNFGASLIVIAHELAETSS